MPSGDSLNRHFVLVDYLNQLSPTLKSVVVCLLARVQTAQIFFISNLERRRPKDYLNINFDSISGIARCVSSS